MRKRKREWREKGQGGWTEGGRGREGRGRGGEIERKVMHGHEEGGRACEVEEMHSGQESCMRTKGRADVWRENFRLVSALSATFPTNSMFEHFQQQHLCSIVTYFSLNMFLPHLHKVSKPYLTPGQGNP